MAGGEGRVPQQLKPLVMMVFMAAVNRCATPVLAAIPGSWVVRASAPRPEKAVGNVNEWNRQLTEAARSAYRIAVFQLCNIEQCRTG